MAKKVRGFITYKSYSFRDKDPIIDALRTAVSDSRKSYTKLHTDSGVSVAAIRGWFTGKTKRPQFTTVAAVALACGKRNVSLSNGKAKLTD